MRKSKYFNMKKGFGKVLIGILLILVLVGVVFALIIVLKGSPEESEKCGNGVCGVGENNINCPQDCKIISKCGNNVCEKGEGCYTCPEDCKCESGQYCSEEQNSCIEPVCGNGKCEIYESPENCCLDCPCTIPGEECNETSKSCEISPFALNDSIVLGLVKNYVENEGKTIKTMEIYATSEYNGELVKLVRVNTNEDDWPLTLAVEENQTVFELPTA